MLKSTSFVFDGVPSETYGVMIYFMDDDSTRELNLGTNVEMIEDRLPKRTTPIHYGVDMNQAMSFPLTFGSTEYLSDYDVDAILSWLTGHQQYKWLEYVDGDHYVRYKCHLNNVQSVYINGLPVAFTCDVECDGQFGYEYPIITEVTAYSDSVETIELLNKSSYNGYLYPKLELELDDNCNGLSIINESDNNREFKINYFDRQVTDTANNEQLYDTTIAKEASVSSDDVDYMSWIAYTLPTSNYYGQIIYGGDIIVALPVSSNIALYSEDDGNTWQETTLPESGEWRGCYGENGFVAICTTPDTAIATYSQTGKTCNINPIELPITQNWGDVFWVETEGFMPNQYVAIAKGESSIAAVSTSGWAWTSVTLPVSQDWKCVFGGNDKVFAVGGNSNIALESSDCIHWREIQLPVNAAWTSGCYGSNGFIIVCDSLYGSGDKKPIALTSEDGDTWTTIELPIGEWSDVVYGENGYVAVAGRSYAQSYDNVTYRTTTLPASVTSIVPIKEQFICSMGTNKYMLSDAASTVKGTFSLQISAADTVTLSNIYVYAELEGTADDTSYASNGEKLLATNTVEVDPDTEAETVTETGGDLIAVTTDLRYGLGIDGVMMAATYDPGTRTVSVNYIADSNHTSVINAPLTIRIIYEANSTTDLGYDGLTANFDNLNQIITTNKEALNLYEYFNMKFLRLIKGINKLKFQTTSGTCKIKITCEFLRKVGGR